MKGNVGESQSILLTNASISHLHLIPADVEHRTGEKLSELSQKRLLRNGLVVSVFSRPARLPLIHRKKINYTNIGQFTSQVYSCSPREISKEEHQNSVSSGYIALQFTRSSG